MRAVALIGLLCVFVQGQRYVVRQPDEDGYYRQNQDYSYSIPRTPIGFQNRNFRPLDRNFHTSELPINPQQNLPQYRHHFLQTEPNYNIGNKIAHTPAGFRSSPEYSYEQSFPGRFPQGETFLGQVTLNNPLEKPESLKRTLEINSNAFDGNQRGSKSLSTGSRNGVLVDRLRGLPKLGKNPPVFQSNKEKNALDSKDDVEESEVEEENDEGKDNYDKSVKENTNDLNKDEEYYDDEQDEEYDDESEEYVQENDETTTPSKTTKSYDVLTTKPSTLMKDNNFNDFVDTSSLHTTSQRPKTNDAEKETPMTVSVSSSVGTKKGTTKINDEDKNDKKTQKEYPELVVSVVTSKTIVNNTVVAPVTTADGLVSSTESLSNQTLLDDNSTESWIVVASVQTSRSVSGARYIPFSVIEQDERVKLLNEPDEMENSTNITPTEDDFSTEDVLSTLPETSTKIKTSTESLIDKLDRVQSDLSSGLLTGGFKNDNIAVIKENSPDKMDVSTMETITSTTTPTIPTTTKPYPQVNIRRYSPGNRPTTPKSKRLLPKATKPSETSKAGAPKATAQDDITSLLPPGYKPRAKEGSSAGLLQEIFAKLKPSDTKANNLEKVNRSEELLKNVKEVDIAAFLPPGFKLPQSEHSTEKTPDISSLLKNVKPVEDISSLLPPGYKPPKSADTSDIFEKAKPVDISALLPKGYKPPKTDETTKLFEMAKPVDDISALLPPGYKLPKTTSTTNSPISDILAKAKPVNDISALLPPGYKNKPGPKNATKGVDNLLKNAQPVDISAFLPPGYNKFKTSTPKTPVTISQELPSNLLPPGYKAPSKTTKVPDNLLPPGFKAAEETKETTTSSAPVTSTAAGTVKVVFPSRPGGARKTARITTPKPVEKSINKPTSPTIQKGWPVRASTEFTGWPTPSTTPISIEKLLEAARTASTSTSTTSSSTTVTTTRTTTTTTTTPKPTTPGICTGDCDLAGTIKLIGGAKWAPELLDRNTKEYQILANDVENELESIYSSSPVLKQWYRKIRIDGFSEGSVLVDYLVELNEIGRQVDTQEIKRLFHQSLMDSSPKNREPKSLNQSAVAEARIALGQFEVDPKYTDFVVIPKGNIPTIGYSDENVLLPQWAIAVIVIGLASLLFVIIFGATVLVNRHKNSKKSPVPLTEDMLNDLNKSHMGGFENFGADDFYNMDDVWENKPYENKFHKKRSDGSIHDNSMSNLYDSWRSEWNQNMYSGYYPHASSQHSGYSGRRRPDYDTNF